MTLRPTSARKQIMQMRRDQADRARKQAALSIDERLAMVICARLNGGGCQCLTANVVAVCSTMKFAASAARRYLAEHKPSAQE